MNTKLLIIKTGKLSYILRYYSITRNKKQKLVLKSDKMCWCHPLHQKNHSQQYKKSVYPSIEI